MTSYAHTRLFLAKMLGLQIKAIDPMVYLMLNNTPVLRNRFWVRPDPEAIDHVLPSLGDLWSAALLAYISDFCLLGPALTQRPNFRITKMVSLNHTMWFFANRTLRSPSEWIFMDLSLIHSSNNVFLVDCQLWSEDRQRLLGVCNQQGLVRPAKKHN